MLFVNSKYVLLTYAQCGDLDEWRVLDVISALRAECIIARELHQDGGVHLHVFVGWETKFRSRRVDIFDVDGRHPNVSPSRGTPEKGYDYAIKDGEVVAGGLERPRPRGGMLVGAGAIRNVSHLCEDSNEFLELFDELDRGTLFKSFVSIRQYANWRYRCEPEEYRTPSGYSWLPGDMDGRDDWISQSGIRSDDPLLGRVKSLILIGDSQMGKTDWARSLGSHLFFPGMFSAATVLESGPAVKYAVFDDMRGGIGFFPAWKEWLGCQREISVRKLHHDAVTWKWGRPAIWCCNRDPRTDMQREKSGFFQDDVDWLEANCMFIDIGNTRLY
jgi:hypothetical protein